MHCAWVALSCTDDVVAIHNNCCDTVALGWKKIDRNLTKIAPIEKYHIHSRKVYVILICVCTCWLWLCLPELLQRNALNVCHSYKAYFINQDHQVVALGNRFWLLAPPGALGWVTVWDTSVPSHPIPEIALTVINRLWPDQYSWVRPSSAKLRIVQPSSAKYSQVQPGSAKYSQCQPSTAKYSLVQPKQPGRAKYSLVKPSRV